MPSDPEELAARAEQLRLAGRPEAAQDLLTEALGVHPDAPLLLVELSATRRALGDLPGAEQAARAALQQAPQWPLALLRLTIVLVQQNRPAEAVGAASALLAVDAQIPAGWAYLALAQSGLRRGADRAAARASSRQAIELAPEDASFRFIGALVEHSLGDVVTARRLVESGLEIDPQSPSLLALRAEYAPVAQQPALLVDVLAANPGDQESRELLDAAVTWERRVALAAGVLLAPAVAAVAGAGAPAVVTSVAALLALGGGGLVLRRFRRRQGVLPAGYLAMRASAARGTAAIRVLVAVTAAGLLLGAVAAWFAAAPALLLLAAAVAAGWLAVLAALPDDARVLATARRRTGRVRWGTAWRFGGLRQELALWSALVVGTLGLIGVLAGSAGPAAGAIGWACGAGVVVQLADAVVGGINAPQSYLRTIAVRYRFLIACLMAFALLSLGSATLLGADTSDPTEPEGPAPSGSLLPAPVPTVSIPSFDFTMAPVPTLQVSPVAGR